jgi:hypothetical protein
MTNAFPILTTALSPQGLESFGKAMAALARLESEPVILQVEHKDLRGAFNNSFNGAWKAVVREPFCNAGRWQVLNEHERKLEGSILYPECHTIAGQLKRVEGAVKADGAMREAMLGLLQEIAPLAARINALKDKVGKRAPKPSKTSIARAERDAKAMHCQCCGEAILAETGVIAHHGYRRPLGMGYQTQSCFGARALPFEVSRHDLGRYIEALHGHVQRTQDHLAQVRAESVAVTWTYTDRSNCTQSWHRGVEKKASVTRDTLAAEIETARSLGYFSHAHIVEPTFDRLKEATERNLLADIGATKQEIQIQQARYDGWTQTHKRDGDRWVAVAV